MAGRFLRKGYLIDSMATRQMSEICTPLVLDSSTEFRMSPSLRWISIKQRRCSSMPPNKTRPGSHFAWDAFRTRQLDAHALSKKHSSLGWHESAGAKRHDRIGVTYAHLGLHKQGYSEINRVASHHIVFIEQCLSSLAGEIEDPPDVIFLELLT